MVLTSSGGLSLMRAKAVSTWGSPWNRWVIRGTGSTQVESDHLSPAGWNAWWAASTVKKGYSGVAVFSRAEPIRVEYELPDPDYRGEGRALHLEYPEFHYFNIYFPNGGEEVEPGDRRYYAPTGLLYKVREGQGHTTQESWTPDKTPAMWAVVDVTHAGTAEDPIPAAKGMDYVYGKYYSDPEDGKLYLCKRTGEEDGGTINLQYLPHELIGQYFEAVEA